MLGGRAIVSVQYGVVWFVQEAFCRVQCAAQATFEDPGAPPALLFVCSCIPYCTLLTVYTVSGSFSQCVRFLGYMSAQFYFSVSA